MGVNQDTNQQQQSTAMSEGFARAQSAQQGQQPQGRQQVNQQQQQPAPHSLSWRGLGRQFGGPMGRSPASEQLVKLEQALTEKFKTIPDPNYKVGLIPLDLNNNPSISLSVLVVCLTLANEPQLGVGYHSLILAGSGEPLPARMENVGGTNVEVFRAPGEAYDDIMRQVIAEAVAQRYPDQRLWEADGQTVPKVFDISNDRQVHELAANAVTAAYTELETRRPDFRDFTLVDTQRDPNLTARVTFNNEDIVNTVGEPVRADIQIELVANALMQQGQVTERASKLTQMAGFMNLIWLKPAPGANAPMIAGMNYQQQRNPDDYRIYAAEFVITSLESLEVQTLPAQLLALIPALALRDNNAWYDSFRRAYTGEEDWHDIGAVGIEANLDQSPTGYGTRYDTKSDSFVQSGMLAQLISSVVRPGMILSQDIPECGDQTWFNGTFGAAAEGDEEANRRIIAAANFLTGGAFGRHYQQLGGNGRVATEAARIYLGYFIDGQGRKRDIRAVDYLAVANLVGEKNPLVIRDWSESMYGSKHAAMRMFDRKKIMENIIQPNITGYARRVTYEAAFTEALVRGCAEAGLTMRTQFPYSDQAVVQRSAPAFAGSAILAPGQSGVFNQGYTTGQQGTGFRRAFSRWA